MLRRHLAGLALATLALPASAQGDKIARLVIGFPAGQATDVIARLLADGLKGELGETVIVDNKPGQGGSIAMGQLAKSPNDGSVMMLTHMSAVATNPHLYRSVPYDSLKDLAPVGQVFRAVSVLLSRKDLPANTVGELVALARAQPGRLSYGTAGKGSPQHIQGEAIKRLGNIDVLHVPFKSAQQALNEVMGGRVDYQVGTVLITEPAYKAGKVKVLALNDPAIESGDLSRCGAANVVRGRYRI